MLIDAHQHFWDIARPEVAWPTPDLAAIHRSFGPAELRSAAGGQALAGTVLVQSQPDDRDTDWLCAQAEREALVLGVVGWVDLPGADAPARIAALARRPKLRGLRPMLQGLAPKWILQPELGPAIGAMVEAGLCFDALVRPAQLPPLLDFARRWPMLPIVVDHGGKPEIGGDGFPAWAEAMAGLAQLPNVHAKLSGLLTEAPPGADDAALAPYVDHLVAAFGPGRLMWGSDWPVVTLRASYSDWAARAFALAGLEGAALAQLRGGTARRFYRL